MNPRLKGASEKLLATSARTLEAGTGRTYIDRPRGAPRGAAAARPWAAGGARAAAAPAREPEKRN